MIETLPRNNARDYEFRERALGVLGWSEWSDPVYVPNDFTRAVAAAERDGQRGDHHQRVRDLGTIDALDKNANSPYLVRLADGADVEGADPMPRRCASR